MRAPTAMVLLALLTAALPAAAAPLQWLPRESWPGGAQADARLDQPVKLWATALPLREVFAQLQSQTGVPLGFDPPDDDNARLCVNIYLNPKTPPTLREVMTQLSWVMDCGFTVTGEGDARRYLLLTAGPPPDVEKLRAAEDEARVRQELVVTEQREQELRARGLRRLQELRAALALPRDEAIRRYRGRDDALLLMLLDPPRRARAQLVTMFSEEQLQRLAQTGSLNLSLPDWTPEQRAFAEDVTGLPSTEQEGDGKSWLTGACINIASEPGAICLSWSTAASSAVTVGEGAVADPRLSLGPGLISPDQAITFRRALGETLSPAMEQEVWNGYAARDLQQYRARQRDEVTTALADAEGDVSAPLRTRLEKLALPLSLAAPHTLWEVQQAVASATGLNVISDHFSQPARDLRERAQWLVSEGLPEPTALLLTQLLAAAHDRAEVAWEWGEAGAFLRFRSRARAEWRAALLPQPLLDALDADLARLLPPPAESPQLVRLTVDLRPYQALITELSPLRLDEGRLIADGRPPEDPLRAAREHVLLGLARSQPDLAFLAGFDDARWARLQAEGLDVAGDLSLDQLAYLRRRFREEEVEAGNLQEVTLRLAPVPDPDSSTEFHPPVAEVKHHLFRLQCLRRDQAFYNADLVRSVELTLTLPAAH